METEMAVTGGGGEEAVTTMRIHVRGLGGNVKVEDLEKTFSSLGRVSRVELVSRPEGGKRFGYMDFEPNSEKSLVKLFATYNGCIWKGGKLKLEKAKEHYLDRLQREWNEATEIEVTKDNSEDSKKSKSMPLEKLQLKLFFPKLQKVKALPFKGTGKHKYSFRRIEVPPLPIHFCDCEEHCRPEVGSSESYISLSNQNGGVGKKEISVMNCVMKRLFEKEKDGKSTDAKLSQTTSLNNSEVVKDKHISEMDEAVKTEDDDLVTNIGSRKCNSMLDIFQDTSGAQDGEGQNHTRDSVLKREKSSKRQKTGKHSQMEEPGTNQKNVLSVASDKDRISKNLLRELQDFSIEPTDQDNINQNNAADTSIGDSSSLQKSSWKKLIADAKTSNFTVSQLLPSSESVNKRSLKQSVPGSTKKAKKVSFKLDEEYPNSYQVKDLVDSEGLLDKVNEMKKSSEDDATMNEDASEQDTNVTVSQSSSNSESNNTTEELISLAAKEKNSSEVHLEDPQGIPSASPDQLQSNQTLTTDQLGQGSCWLQKSSWTQLVGNTHVSTFSISQLVPDIDALKPKTTVPSNLTPSTVGAKLTSKYNMRHSKGKGVTDTRRRTDDSNGKLKSTVNDSTPEKTENKKVTSGEKNGVHLKTDSPSTDSGNVFTFMRSDASEMQWAKSRAALVGQLARKNKSDATKKHSREWPSRRN